MHLDQTYCVPDRSIYDNINLIRDAINYSNNNNLPLAVINLDQKKAFDNVDHGYFFQTMRAMGFGDTFLRHLGLLYSGSESLVKVCDSLTAPFSFEKGIRLGCPLSGLLYSIAIEPLLVKLRKNLINDGISLPDAETRVAVSAYADDVTAFLTSDASFRAVEEAYDLFARASAARLNKQQSQGLWVGSWAGRVDTPLGFLWNSKGLVFLGVHLGNTQKIENLNWSKCKNKLQNTLSKWRGLAKRLSFKGRVLIANQLAASQTCHYIATLSPPSNVLSELQAMLVDFVWPTKRHYLNKQTTFEKPDSGGLGLVCLQARMLTFRFKQIQNVIKNSPHPAFSFFKLFLHRYKKFNFDLELFFINTDPAFYVALPQYYSDIMRAWTASGARIQFTHDCINHVLNLPVNCSLFSPAADDGASTCPLFPRLLLDTWRAESHTFVTSSTLQPGVGPRPKIYI